MATRNVILLAALFAASAVAGFMVYNSTRSTTAAEAQPGDNAPATTMRPLISLMDVSGQNRSITEWDGKALVVNFWATWCAPCRREIPVLMALQKELAEKDIQFIGIAIDDAESVSRYAAQNPFNYPILVGEQEGIDAAEAFGADVVALPMTIFTDHAGHIIDLHAGEITREEIIAILKRLPQ